MRNLRFGLKAITTVCVLFANQSFSQDQVTEEALDELLLEEIIVTGSRIKRRDFASPSPLATIDREDLEAAGRATLEETLNLMPQVQPDLSRSVNNGGDGTATVNLRGIGAGRTLVLLNGRRFAPSGTGSAVDINNIPQSLIERVEIITGGASTVYGSDAIAGVVNFITRDDLEGLALDANYSITGESDAQIYSVDVSYGLEFADGRGQIAFYAGYYDREELFAGERAFTTLTLVNDNDTGEVVEFGSLATPSGVIFAPPVDLGAGPGPVTFDPDGTPRPFINPDDRYNFQPINYIQTPLSRESAGLFGTYELGSDYELYFEGGFAQNDAALQIAEVPAFIFVPVNVDNPVLTPETRQLFEDNYQVEPGLAVIGLGRRLSEVGPRMVENERDYWRAVLGVRGDLTADWDIDAWVSYTRTDEKQFFTNDALRSRFAQGLLVDPATGQCFDPSGGCVPLDIFGAGRISPEAAEFLRVTDVQNDTERVQKLASVVVTGSLFDTWAGAVDKAFGAEWRSDEASFKADDILFTGDTLGFRGQAPVEGTETVFELYTELLVPLAEDLPWAEYLALEAGVRYSSYDLAGGVWTWKLGTNWEVVPGLRFRGMSQRSVRAPNNEELFTEQFSESGFFVGTNSSDDPCSASNDPVGAGLTEKCVIQGLPADQVGVFEAFSVPANFIAGGNPDLVPEEADTLTFGVVIEPESLPKWQFSVDYFDIELTDSIGDVDSVAVCFDPSNTANLFCDNIRRDPAAGFNVVEVTNLESNRGNISARGIDTQIRYRTDLPEALAWFDNPADLAINIYWTRNLENDWQLSPVSGVIDCLGIFGDFCPMNQSGIGATVPENRVFGEFHYTAGKLSLSLLSSWIEGTANGAAREAEFFGLPAPLLAVPSIGSEYYLNLGVGYEVTDRLFLRFGVNNLTDNDPPLMPGAFNNTDTVFYDLYGRSYFLTLSAQLFQ